MQQISVLETNIGSSTTGNSDNTQVIFNDAGTLRGDAGLTYNKTTDTLSTGSATITGDLTVNTNVLKVDSTNDRVGIGTASPNNTLTVRGTQDAGIEVNSADSNSSRIITAYDPANTRFYINSTNSGSGTVLPLDFLIGNAAQYRIAASGVFSWYDGAVGTRMTLNSTGLGVGTASPAQKVDVNGTLLATNVYLRSDDSDVSWGAGAGSRPIIRGNQTNNTIKFYTASTDRMTLDASGRLLVGSTSAFSDLTGSKEVKIGDGGMQTLTVASLPAATATNIARGGVGGLVYVGGYNGTGQYGAVVLWTAASATVVSVINGTGSTITFGVSSGFLQITSSLVLTQVTASCIRL